MTIANRSGILNPPLKWAGGKRWLVPHLVPIWAQHQHRRLVEPFCGGLAVALGLMPDQALLNDVSPHLVNFYIQAQRGLAITTPMHNDKDLYYTYRDRFNALIREEQADSAEAAQLFYYLNRTGYNGLCRFNRSGEFNVRSESTRTSTMRRTSSPIRSRSRSGSSEWAGSIPCLLNRMISSTPTHPTMWNLSAIRRTGLHGLIRCIWRNGWRSIRGR